jgi:two-component system, NarL family, response regulator DevR
MRRTARVAGQVGADDWLLDRVCTIGQPGTLVHQAPPARRPHPNMTTTTVAAREEPAPAGAPLERPARLPEDGVVSTPPLRVMLVDDHEVVRDGIKALLAATDDIVVCAEAASVRQAIAEADRALPDVIVMDVRLQDGSGIEATRDIRADRPQTQVLMLTSFADDQALFASIMAGAAGYVLKQIRGDDLVQAIRTVGAGQSLLDPAVTKGVLDRLRRGKHLLKDERLARLSPQEERILELVSAGRTNKQIGAELHLAEKTVKNYVSSILAKLEVTRRAEAASYLTRHTTTPGS